MGIDFIVNMVVSQVGEEKAKEVKGMLLGLAEKMTSDKIYILKRLGSKGVCLISTNEDECKINFPNGTPDIIELENMLKKIEV